MGQGRVDDVKSRYNWDGSRRESVESRYSAVEDVESCCLWRVRDLLDVID